MFFSTTKLQNNLKNICHILPAIIFRLSSNVLFTNLIISDITYYLIINVEINLKSRNLRTEFILL